MIYLDTSVVLAHVLAEDRYPPEALWDQPLVSSRLLEYEVRTRVNREGLARSHVEIVDAMVRRMALLELLSPVVERALQPFPVPVRTLDGLHLASVEFLRAQGVDVRLATYAVHQREAAGAMGIPLYEV